MAWTRRETVAIAACVPLGIAAFAVAVFLDSLAVNPDLILALGAAIAVLLVIPLAFAAKVPVPRFFVAGVPVALLAYWATWYLIAMWAATQNHG